MSHLSFTDVFGANATQDATTITILKSDFPALTPLANNNGEQILLAILLNLHKFFEGKITDENQVVICGIDETGEKQEVVYEQFFYYENIIFNFLSKLEPSPQQLAISNIPYGLEDLGWTMADSVIRKFDAVWFYQIIFSHCVPLPTPIEFFDRYWVHKGGILSPDNIKTCTLTPQFQF